MTTSTDLAQNEDTTTVVTAPAMTDLVITDDQTTFTDVQLAGLKQLGIDDAPQGDIDLFFHQAKRTGLDPFAKQIYMIGRKTKTGGYRGEPEKWETKYTIQVGIDGFRVAGHRMAHLAGDDLEVADPQWHGAEGSEWTDLWFDAKNPPVAARVTIVRNGKRFTAVAMYSEYVQTKSNGEPNSMWKKMPANQLRKCAEAAAWRMAYPNDFSGIVLEDAVQNTVIDGSVVEAPVRAQRGRGVGGLRAALASKTPDPAADQTEGEPAETDEPTKAEYTALGKLFAKGGIGGKTAADKANRELVASKFLERSDFTDTPLTGTDVRKMTELLEQIDNEGDDVLASTLASLVTEAQAVDA